MLGPQLYSMSSLSKSLVEKRHFASKKSWRILSPCTIRSVLAFILIFYVGVPGWFYLCPWLRRAAVYLHFADWPFQTLSHPEYYGLNGTRHFFVETSPGVLLGVWHILPRSHSYHSDQKPPSFASDNQPVVLYLHGSAESRSAAYRRSMYNVLSNEPIRAHIITFDYRGFGDSTYITPTAHTLEEDAASMFEWLQKHVSASRIIVWGHSMGTGIAVRLGAALARTNSKNQQNSNNSNNQQNSRNQQNFSNQMNFSNQQNSVNQQNSENQQNSINKQNSRYLQNSSNKQNSINPLAIVLEAPFTSIADATRTFPLSFFHRKMPLFETFCTEKTRHPDTNLDSEHLVGQITAPLLILHAADDGMVWSEQGRTLWKKALGSRPAHLHRPVFVELDGKYGCGHRNIHKAPNLPFEVKRFLRSVEMFNEVRTGKS